jgi:hypothetical protein
MGISYAQTPKEQELQIDENAVYMVDWSKMTSVNDMILILASMAIGFPGNHPNIEQLKPFLNLENPIKQQGQPEKKSLDLPKLKNLKK